VPADLDALLEPLRSRPERAGVLTDFDGTLAPIVDDPTMARPLPDAVTALHRLAAVYRRVAVISGRPASFLAEHLALHDREPDPGRQGLLAMGLYGLERAEGGHVTTDPRADEWRRVVDEVAGRADASAPPGLLVERKLLSVTLHFRTAPDTGDWAGHFAAEEEARTGLIVHPGRRSVELRPPLPVDKGTVVEGLAQGLAAACFLGDDRGDLPAFAVLDRLAAEDGVATVKVGVRSEEAPAELLEAADVVVDGPEGALEVLSRLG
jgi:trehalose 6-phosphate phosphatase